MSLQSSASLIVEAPSAMEVDPLDSSIMSIAESVMDNKSGKSGKKGKKAKAQSLLPRHEDPQLASSFIEPEDDDFEVKVEKPVTKKTKGKKRKSESLDGPAEDSSTVAPKKRRTTRSRNSVASVQAAPKGIHETTEVELEKDAHMSDPDDGQQSAKPAPNKRGKKGSKRGSSSARKVSSKSVASEASLRAGLPNDEDIDAALEKDLERPLTDDGEVDEEEMPKPPKGRRLTRTKPARKATDASTAPTRRTTRNSSVAVDGPLAESYLANSTAVDSETQLQDEIGDPLAAPLPNTKASKKTSTRKASTKQNNTGYAIAVPEELPVHADAELEDVRPKRVRGKKLKTSERPEGFSVQEDDASHETGAQPDGHLKRGKNAATVETVNDIDDPQSATEESKKPHKKQGKSAKAAPKATAKSAASKRSKEIAAEVKISEPPGLVGDSSPANGSIHSTPRPAPSPQSSDAENQPPSSRPSQSRPPLSFDDAKASQEKRVPLAVITTPPDSPSKSKSTKLQSSFPWTEIDIDQIFHGSPNVDMMQQPLGKGASSLTSPEKKLNVEEWIKFNAQRAEERLRNDCEGLVGRLEDQGVRALKTLEGIACFD